MTELQTPRPRPSIDDYLMGIAVAVRARANCSGQRVGSVIVQDGRIISTGYNGTPRDMTNCEDGGCHRCSHRTEFVSGTGYDLCICVHAEQNALLAAARFGISVAVAAFYTTTRPCSRRTQEMLQAGIARVFFIHDWVYPGERMRAEYERLLLARRHLPFDQQLVEGVTYEDLDEAKVQDFLRRRQEAYPDATPPGASLPKVIAEMLAGARERDGELRDELYLVPILEALDELMGQHADGGFGPFHLLRGEEGVEQPAVLLVVGRIDLEGDHGPVEVEATQGRRVQLGMMEDLVDVCPLYTSPSPRDRTRSRMPASA